MSVDSVGGGGSSDPFEPLRKKAADERVRDLKRIQTERESEMRRLNEAKEREIEGMRHAQERDIESEKLEMTERLEQLKSLTENRIRNFEADSQRLTTEAQKQFTEKASRLQKSARELEQQREALVRNHEATMREISDKAQMTEADILRRSAREAALAHVIQTKKLQEINDRGNAEADRMTGEVNDRKRRIAYEGDRVIANLKDDYQESANQVEDSILFQKRAGEAQLARERTNFENNRLQEQAKAEDALLRLNMENQRQLNRSHIEGRRKIMDTQTELQREVSTAERDGRKKMRNVQSQYAANMNSLQLEADGQEKLARQAYANQRQAINTSRNQIIEKSITENETIQKKVNEEHSKRATELTKIKNKMMTDQIERDAKEVAYRREMGKQAVNNTIAQSSTTLAAHESKLKDPFYQLHRVGAQVRDTELETWVTIAVPQHEQDNVRVTLQHNNLTVSGTRRNETKAILPDGRRAASNSYQSFSESFPVKGKLLMAQMTRVYDNGQLTFRIPKG